MSPYGAVVVVIVAVAGSDTCEANKQQKVQAVQLSSQGSGHIRKKCPPFLNGSRPIEHV